MTDTVLNLKSRDALAEPMFFGEPLGIQRFDVVKYPKFARSYDVQISNLWRPQEIDMTPDLSSYESLNEVERFIFESNLRFQTAGDSLLSRSIDLLKRHVTNAELEYACNVWGMVENLHSESYTHVLKGITKDPKPFFDSILDDPQLVKRMASIIEPFNELMGEREDDCDKVKLFKAVLALQIAEGVLFYTSFACSFFFAKNGKMQANGKIISLIKRDENEHAALTQNILNNWMSDPSEGFQEIMIEHEDFIKEAYLTARDFEHEWSDYLFSKGEMVGLTKSSLNGYVDWNINNRMRSLGYEPPFPEVKTNPLSWLNEFLDSSRVQVAPQESQIISYKKLNTTNDLASSLGSLDF